MSSISLSDFISCQSTKKPFHFPLKPPTSYLLCFSNPHTDHSLSMASSLRNTERGTLSLTSPRKNQNSHTASPLGLQGKWLYPSPASTEQPSHSGWSMSNMARPSEKQQVGSRGEKVRVDNRNLIIVIICKLGLLHLSLMKYEMGDTPSPVNQDSPWSVWHHTQCRGPASQVTVSSRDGLNWNLGRWWRWGNPSLAQYLCIRLFSGFSQLSQGVHPITFRRAFFFFF